MIEYSRCSWPGLCLHLQRGFHFATHELMTNIKHHTHTWTWSHRQRQTCLNSKANGPWSHDSPSNAELSPSSGTVVVQSCRCCLLSKVLRNDGHLGCHSDLFNPGMATTRCMWNRLNHLDILTIYCNDVCVLAASNRFQFQDRQVYAMHCNSIIF